MDTVANLVPSSVPRSIAKGGVYAVGGLLVFGLIQKVTYYVSNHWGSLKSSEHFASPTTLTKFDSVESTL